MKITKQDAEAARETFTELLEHFNALKDLIRCSLDSEHERNTFKYNCLARCEPGLMEEHDWMVQYDGIVSMEKWVERMEEEANGESSDEDEEEETDGNKA